jgi:hypothetical protein
MGKIEGGAAEVIARVIVTVKQAFPKCTVEDLFLKLAVSYNPPVEGEV